MYIIIYIYIIIIIYNFIERVLVLTLNEFNSRKKVALLNSY